MSVEHKGLGRLLRPTSIAIVGGAWARNVVEQCLRMQYTGEIWPVHPGLDEVHGIPCYRSVEQLPYAPDATFIGVNRDLTVDIVRSLAAMGAGGAVCFASGFSEAAAEDQHGATLQAELLEAARDLTIIGPNCYGLINYLDGALLWPDQHGGTRVTGGVGIVTQSSNIAINLTMQRRGLPIAYVMTAGNQAQVSLADMANALLDDERVSAIGLHVEGFGEVAAWHELALKAKARGVGVVVIKAGTTEQSQAAMVSHTNSLSGTEASADALLERLGLARVHSVPAFLEALKLLHVCGPLAQNTIASLSCSGGEAGLMADSVGDRPLVFPPLDVRQQDALRAALGPKVALANPLDYHTYIWGDIEAMTACFAAMLQTPAAMTFLVIDFPRNDTCSDDSWWVAVEALLAAKAQTGATVALLATLPETLPEAVALHAMSQGVPAFGGVQEALDAVVAAAFIGSHTSCGLPVLQSRDAPLTTAVLSEHDAKAQLGAYGLPVANAITVSSIEHAITASGVTGFPLVVKVSGAAHKTEQGGVVLNVTTKAALVEHCTRLFMQADELLVEPYFGNAVAELLIGVVREPDGLFRLTVGAGGVLAELLHDTLSLLLPVSDEQLQARMQALKIYPLLNGYRGQVRAEMSSVYQAITQLCQWVEAHHADLVEAEINPLLCLEDRAVVVDALITASDSLRTSS